MMWSEAMFSSSKGDWRTPLPLFKRAAEVFGDFDLDACANSSNHLCDRYFSLSGIDGRGEDWWEHGSNIWCNPVYSRNKEDMAWPFKKALEACEQGCSVTFLVFARLDTEWAHKYVLGKADVHCIEGRVRFSAPAPAPRGFPPDMKRKPVAPAPSVLLHFTQETVAGSRPTLIRSFSETCASIGLPRPQLWDAFEPRVRQRGNDASP
jgi:phage N-6-adenine-methyltransferase